MPIIIASLKWVHCRGGGVSRGTVGANSKNNGVHFIESGGLLESYNSANKTGFVEYCKWIIFETLHEAFVDPVFLNLALVDLLALVDHLTLVDREAAIIQNRQLTI